MSSFRKILPVFLFLFLFGLVLGMGSFAENEDSTTYLIRTPADTHGTCLADKDGASAGETVTLTLKPNRNYTLDTLTIQVLENRQPTGEVVTAQKQKENIYTKRHSIKKSLITRYTTISLSINNIKPFLKNLKYFRIYNSLY